MLLDKNFVDGHLADVADDEPRNACKGAGIMVIERVLVNNDLLFGSSFKRHDQAIENVIVYIEYVNLYEQRSARHVCDDRFCLTIILGELDAESFRIACAGSLDQGIARKMGVSPSEVSDGSVRCTCDFQFSHERCCLERIFVCANQEGVATGEFFKCYLDRRWRRGVRTYSIELRVTPVSTNICLRFGDGQCLTNHDLLLVRFVGVSLVLISAPLAIACIAQKKPCPFQDTALV